jgi:hypothetical protein
MILKVNKMKPYISIRLYPQTQTIATNIDYYNRKGELTQSTDTRYIVDHIYEIIFPIVEQYGNTHDITVHSMGERLDINQLAQSFNDYFDGVMNGEIE